MADDTYMPLVYMVQGGNEQVVASGGLVTVESGGSVDIESGGGIDIQSGGDITIESGGSIAFPSEGSTLTASASTSFPNNGVTFITSSGDVRKFSIDAPVAGCHKWLYFTAGSTAMVHYIAVGTGSDGIGILSTAASATAHMMVRDGTTASALAGFVHLVGKSATRWIKMEQSPATSFVIVSTSS